MNIHYRKSHFETRHDVLQEGLESVLLRAGYRRADRLVEQLSDLELVICRAARTSKKPDTLAETVEKWLGAEIAEIDDELRRATVAALLLYATRRAPLPPCMAALWPETQDQILRFLQGPHVYDRARFAADLALAVGSAASVGALTVTIPTSHGGLYDRTRRAAGSLYREARQRGPGSAVQWLMRFGVGRIAELHVDTRNLRDFNREGFLRSYHRLAALLEARPDIKGVCGLSWLYDPQLADVSPNLAFIRETAAAGGGRFLRLRTDPVQIGYALARSPTRRALHERGLYDPVCYGMYWDRRALIDWSRRSGDLTPDRCDIAAPPA